MSEQNTRQPSESPSPFWPYPKSECWTCRHVRSTGHCGAPGNGPCTEEERQLYEPRTRGEASSQPTVQEDRG